MKPEEIPIPTSGKIKLFLLLACTFPLPLQMPIEGCTDLTDDKCYTEVLIPGGIPTHFLLICFGSASNWKSSIDGTTMAIILVSLYIASCLIYFFYKYITAK
ncbi:MAG: hypothetical protein KAU03_02955 [Candidatus Altiarchaeales archaeon]|nr:hypothetical protein [Candidatus Altiarchaeales archaeon]